MRNWNKWLRPAATTILAAVAGAALMALSGGCSEPHASEPLTNMTDRWSFGTTPQRSVAIHDERDHNRFEILQNKLTVMENSTNVRLHNMEEILHRLDERTRILDGAVRTKASKISYMPDYDAARVGVNDCYVQQLAALADISRSCTRIASALERKQGK